MAIVLGILFLSFVLFVLVFYICLICGHVSICTQEHMEIKGQLPRVGSLLRTVWVSESEFHYSGPGRLPFWEFCFKIHFFIIIFNFVCVLECACVCRGLQKSEALGPSGAGVKIACRRLMWEANAGSLQEQYPFLITEPSLRHPFWEFLNKI